MKTESEYIPGTGVGINKDDTISRQAAIELAMQYCPDDDGSCSKADRDIRELLDDLENLPSAQPDYQDVLGWLLAYHTMSFDLHGRYLPHEVISWLINDFTKEFIAGREQDE